jgi:transcriptional regulator NrdR family protein
MKARSIDAINASYFLALKQCQSCHGEIFAAVGAERVRDVIKYRWHCDLCDHRFETVESVEEVAA